MNWCSACVRTVRPAISPLVDNHTVAAGYVLSTITSLTHRSERESSISGCCGGQKRFSLLTGGITRRTPSLLVPSQLVPPCSPVVPVSNRLLGLLIAVDDLQLGEGDRQRVPLPGHEHEHLVRALLLWCHPHHVDLITDAQWRGRTPGDAGGQEGELQMLLQVVIPADRLLLGPIGINDDLHMDTLFAFLFRGNALHRDAPIVPSNCRVKTRVTAPSLPYGRPAPLRAS